MRGQKVAVGLGVQCGSERSIFKALGLNYVPPHLRSVYQNFKNSKYDEELGTPIVTAKKGEGMQSSGSDTE